MNIFIDWPNFTRKSNGIVCLYDLSRHLSQAGLSVYGVPRNLRSFFKSFNNLSSAYQDIRVAERPFGSAKDVFIVADTVPEKTIRWARKQKIRIIWWQLAPYGLLDATAWPKTGDLSLPFSSYADASFKNYFYYQPNPDAYWQAALSESRPTINTTNNTRICIYSGKGRLKTPPPRILALCSQSEVICITRKVPSSRKQLIELLRSSHGLISFDEFSAINLEAASLGIPVFLANPLFEQTCRQKFTVEKLRTTVTEIDLDFCQQVMLSAEHKPNPWKLDDLKCCNEKTLANWMALLKNPERFSEYAVTEESLLRCRHYTRSLKKRRVISINYRGEAGSSLLVQWLAAGMSRGRVDTLLEASARLLDYLYIALGPLLIRLERLLFIQRLIAKRNKFMQPPAFNSGHRTFSIRTSARE